MLESKVLKFLKLYTFLHFLFFSPSVFTTAVEEELVRKEKKVKE